MLARCTANGLAHMHQRGLCHLDVKPDNLLIRREASGLQGYLSDFGLSAKKEEFWRGGTLDYLPPTVKWGGQTKASPDIDTWSLGLFIVELLYGEAWNPMRDISQRDVLEEKHVRLCTRINKDESSPLKELLLGLLDLDPSKRPSAVMARQVLDEVLSKMTGP